MSNDGNEMIKILRVSETMADDSMEDIQLTVSDGETEDDNYEYVTVMVSDNDYGDIEHIEGPSDEAMEETINAAATGDINETVVRDDESTPDASNAQRRTRRPNFKCGECGKVLSNIGSYKYHLQLHSNKTPFKCDKCSATFKTKNAYDGHMIMHNPNNPNTCHICGKSYRQSASLEGHMRSHTGEKVRLLQSVWSDNEWISFVILCRYSHSCAGSAAKV